MRSGFPRALCLPCWLAVVLAAANSCSQEPTGPDEREAGLAAALGAPVRTVATAGAPPVIDGDLDESVWHKAHATFLPFADRRVEGVPARPAAVRVLAQGREIYLGFEVRGSAFARAKDIDDPKLLNDAYIGVAIKVGEACFLVLVNAKGAVYHARRQGVGSAWEAAWRPAEMDLKTRTDEEGWSAELRLVLDELQDEQGRLPKLWRADFIRRPGIPSNLPLWERNKPLKGLNLLRNVHAWVPRSMEACERLTRLDLFPDEDFGWLHWPESPGALPGGMAQRLEQALAEGDRTRREKEAAKQTRKPGFEFSVEELERHFAGAPVLLVPRTSHPPEIDGNPDDQAWQAAEPVTLGFLSSRIGGRPERNRTRVALLCDERFLYARFECEEDEPDAIRATPGLADGGELWKEDVCNLLLDPGRSLDVDSSGYADLLVNAAGSVNHILRRSDTSWDPPSLVVATRRFEQARRWVIELKLAYEDLHLDPRALPKVWGANFLRSRTPGRGEWIARDQMPDPAYFHFDFAWSGNPDGAVHQPHRFGVLYLQAGKKLPPDLLSKLQAREEGFTGLLPSDSIQGPRPTPTPLEPARPRPAAEFAREPVAVAEEGGMRLSFALAEPGHVEISVQDAGGRTVRHLAAGLLGRNAPPPFRPVSLEQDLTWDFKDDAGQKIKPGRYRLQVKAGMRLETERFLLWNPNGFRNVLGLATGRDGTVYVLQEDKHVWYQAPYILAFDRQGNYLRQVLPYSNRLPEEKLAGATRIQLPGGERIPAVQHGLYQALAPAQATFGAQRFAADPSGALCLLNGIARTETRFDKRLLRIGSDGGMDAGYLGPRLGCAANSRGPATVAIAPDGRFAYVSGLRGGWAVYDEQDSPHHVVYRLEWNNEASEAGMAKPFLGQLRRPGNAPGLLRDPRGLALDAAGRLYVADFGNDRVLIFLPDGSPSGSLSVPRPEQLEVHPRKGTLYVLSLEKGKSVLRRYPSAEAAEATAFCDLPEWEWACLALDASADPPRLWLAGASKADKYGIRDVLAIDDTQDGLVSRGNAIGEANHAALNRSSGLPSFIDAAVDGEGRYAAVWNIAVDTQTGRPAAEDIGPLRHRGRDGRYYEISKRPRALRRFDETGREIPFATLPNGSLSLGNKSFEFDAGPDGRLYVFHDSGVDVYRPDGSLERAGFIRIPQAPRTSHGVKGTIRVDDEGCVYLASNMKPLDEEIPREFEGRIPDTGQRPSLPFVYRHLYGSVLKFGPQGGRIELDKEGAYAWCTYYAGRMRCRAEGLEWMHFGLSPIRYRDVGHLPCTCETARFDVDRFGRVFLPDALRFSVRVLDKAGNTILRSGGYGNMDDGHPGTPGPANPALAWPVSVFAREGCVYVADKLNRRLVKLAMRWQAERTVAVEVP